MNKKDVKLKRRLELVRTTIRKLDQNQLGQVAGGESGSDTGVPSGCHFTLITIPAASSSTPSNGG